MAQLISADDQGRVQLPEGSAGRDYGLYRNPTGKIELVPLPMAQDTDDGKVISSDPALTGGPYPTQEELDRYKAELLERRMIEAVTAYFANDPAGGGMTSIRALEIRAVTNNGDLCAGERVIYRTGDSYNSLLLLAAPLTGNGACEPPFVRGNRLGL